MSLRKNILIKPTIDPNPLRVWMGLATPRERLKLATLAKTTLGNLQQISGGYRTAGAALLDSDLACRIEAATEKMARDGLPTIAREALSPACHACNFAKRCRAQDK